MPVEFSRLSRDCRLTLVIDYENPNPVETRLVLSPRVDLEHAIEDLSQREGTSKSNIGFVDKRHNDNSGHQRMCSDIGKWLDQADFDAVVWTALSSNFKSEVGREFSIPAAVSYLQGLPQSTKKLALRYIANAPVDTPLRRKLMEIGLIQE